MKFGQIPQLDKQPSRVVLGAEYFHTIDVAGALRQGALCDVYFEAGGRAFDTAYAYADGHSESVLGAWLASRGARADVVLIAKGAHPPTCSPAEVGPQLEVTLERLRTDHVDLYMPHRDDESFPVDEWVDALAAQVAAGRTRAYGVSNWSVERVAAANAYADRRGLPRIAAVSNQLSLPDMVAPQWPGCLSACDPQSSAWFQKTQTPLVAFSSLGGGFLAGKQSASRQTWFSDGNLARRERATALAGDRGVSPVAIGLAWVLARPFPTFAIVGVRSPEHLLSTLQGVSVELAPDECEWLECG